MGAAWWVLGFLLSGAPVWWCVVPVLVALAIFAWARAVFRGCAPRSAEEERRIGKLIGRWSAAEGVGIGVAAFVLGSIGEAAFIPSAIAVIVGLHFFPLARGVPMGMYYLTGAALLAAGVGTLAAPAVFGVRALGLVCGVVLWGTALGLVLRARRGLTW